MTLECKRTSSEENDVLNVPEMSNGIIVRTCIQMPVVTLPHSIIIMLDYKHDKER